MISQSIMQDPDTVFSMKITQWGRRRPVPGWPLTSTKLSRDTLEGERKHTQTQRGNKGKMDARVRNTAAQWVLGLSWWPTRCDQQRRCRQRLPRLPPQLGWSQRVASINHAPIKSAQQRRGPELTARVPWPETDGSEQKDANMKKKKNWAAVSVRAASRKVIQVHVLWLWVAFICYVIIDLNHCRHNKSDLFSLSGSG